MTRPIPVILYCLLLGFIMGVLGYIYDLNNRYAELKRYTATLLELELEDAFVAYRQFNQDAVQHAIFFASVPLVERALQESEPRVMNQLAGFMGRFAQLYGRYSQVRLLDANGFEVIRFDRSSASSDEVLRAQILQDKSSRDYIQRAKALPAGSVYVGPLTPNQENGELVEPHEATFRVVAPIDTADGTRLGYFVLNARAGDFLSTVARNLLPEVTDYDLILFDDRLGTWRFSQEEWFYSSTAVDHEPTGDTVNFAVTLASDTESGNSQKVEEVGRMGLANLEANTAVHIATDFVQDINFLIKIPVDAWNVYQTASVDSLNSQRMVTILSRALSASLLLAMATLLYIKRLKAKHQEHKELSRKIESDHLTGVLSRAGLDARLERFGTSDGQNRPSLALCVLDIDHFKAINDQYGHSTGDMVLVQLAKLLNGELRDTDLFARWGGEEFLIVLHGVSPQVAYKVAERYRRVVEQFTFTGEAGGALKITLSLGVAMFNSGLFEDAFTAADQALYKAKNAGRNQVCLHEQGVSLQSIGLGDTLPNLEVLTDRGTLRLREYMGTSWLVLFSHPKDFTPVCTTELAVVARRAKDWEVRNTKVIALSVDGLGAHQQWIDDIQALAGCAVDYPIIADTELDLAKLFDMLPEDAYITNERTVEEAQTVRGVFIFAPDARLQASLMYPMSVGRNFDDITRLLDALQARWRDSDSAAKR